MGEISQISLIRPNLNPYLEKYALRTRLIRERPSADLGLVVVIPACNEPHIEDALSSLYNCTPPDCATEVIVVVNASESAPQEVVDANARTAETCRYWKGIHDSPAFRIHLIEEPALSRRKAGVGIARKIGMDEAVRRLDDVGNPEGIIACFDADSTCAPDYLQALCTHFRKHKKTPGCDIRFAHPTFGGDYDAKNYLAISYYELHLRYYNQAIRAAGFPNAFHTVGSSMAVRASAYAKQGGMNTRKAGEDFYFLHKIIALGGFTSLHTTTVYPSPRPSDRVPFGTGKAVADYLQDDKKGFYTYNLQAFKYLHTFFKHIPEFYITAPKPEHLGGDLPYIVIDFLSAYFFEERIAEIRANSRGYNSFEKRFYRWFNAFMILKFVHFVRDNAHPNVRVERAAMDFLRAAGVSDISEIRSVSGLLGRFRKLDEAPPAKQLRFSSSR